MPPPGDRPIAFAHRGFSQQWPENSLSAFQAAVDLGYQYLETDARVSADGVAIAFHDSVLDRVTNDRGQLERLSWAKISRARILGQAPIPPLAELLLAFPSARFNIDVKSDRAVGPTLDVLRDTNAWERVRLAAFSHRRLLTIRAAAGPRVATALTPPEIVRLRLGLNPSFPDGTDRAAQVPIGLPGLAVVDRRFVDHAHRLGLAVHVWTVNQRAEMIRLLELGVDGIMTDRADVLRSVLIERGQWT